MSGIFLFGWLFRSCLSLLITRYLRLICIYCSLVELIVLNIGLQAGILNNAVFAMFVVMALVTTFVTTPLTTAFYPERYWRNKLAMANGELAAGGGAGGGSGPGGKGKESENEKDGMASHGLQDGDARRKGEEHFRRRFVVVLERLESLPSMMAFVKMLQPSHDHEDSPPKAISHTSASTSDLGYKSTGDATSTDAVNELSKAAVVSPRTPAASSFLSKISVDAFRLLALSDRTSALLRASESEVTKRADAILNIFSAFANLAFIPHTTSMTIVPSEEYADTVAAHAAETNADLLVVPWVAGTNLDPEADGPHGTPFESIFGQQSVERSPHYANFVRRVFLESSSDVALFLDRGAYHGSTSATAGDALSNALTGRNLQHIFLPFHGGPDDRAALDFVVQLVANNNHMSATVVRFNRVAPEADLGKIESSEAPSEAAGSTSPLTAGHNQFTVGAGLGAQDTVYGGAAQGTQHRLASDTADNLALARYFPSAMLEESDGEESTARPLLPAAMARIAFETVSTSTPLKTTLLKLASLASASKDAVLVIAGRSRHSAPTHRVELEQYLKEKVVSGQGIHTLGIAASSEVRKTLGDVGSAVVVSGEAGSVLVLQSVIKGQAYLKKKGKHV